MFVKYKIRQFNDEFFYYNVKLFKVMLTQYHTLYHKMHVQVTGDLNANIEFWRSSCLTMLCNVEVASFFCQYSDIVYGKTFQYKKIPHMKLRFAFSFNSYVILITFCCVILHKNVNVCKGFRPLKAVFGNNHFRMLRLAHVLIMWAQLSFQVNS